MKRKFVFLLCSLILLMFISVYTFADALKVLSAFASFPTIIPPVITHSVINAVSSIDKILNAKISVNFGSYISAKAKLIYYTNDDPAGKKEEPVSEGKTILNDKDFFISLPQFNDSDESVDYQIEIILRDSNNNIVYEYFPSSTTFTKAIITNSTTSYITANNGGKIVFESGNQEYKNTELNIPANAINKNTNITLTHLPIEPSTTNKEMVAIYKIEPNIEDTEILLPIDLSLYYGIQTNKSKFDLMYREYETGVWKKVTISQTDLTNKVVAANITKFGEYAIFAVYNLSDNDYRPEKRIKVKARISSYGGFKFNNLQEGDVVKIYNVNGKKIAQLTKESDFEWKGRKGSDNSGDWAESGTYIYQIKVNGKVVSGTIAFVW